MKEVIFIDPIFKKSMPIDYISDTPEVVWFENGEIGGTVEKVTEGWQLINNKDEMVSDVYNTRLDLVNNIIKIDPSVAFAIKIGKEYFSLTSSKGHELAENPQQPVFVTQDDVFIGMITKHEEEFYLDYGSGYDPDCFSASSIRELSKTLKERGNFKLFIDS